MRSSTERHIEGILIDVSDLDWTALMQSGDGALSKALRGRAALRDREAGVAGGGFAEHVSAFNNFV